MEVPHKHVQVHTGSGAQAPLPVRSNTASFHLVRGPGGQLTKEAKAAAFDSHCAEIDAPCCHPRLLIHKLKAWQLDAEKCPMLVLFVEHYQAWRKCVANYMEVGLDAVKAKMMRVFYGGKPTVKIPFARKPFPRDTTRSQRLVHARECSGRQRHVCKAEEYSSVHYSASVVGHLMNVLVFEGGLRHLR